MRWRDGADQRTCPYATRVLWQQRDTPGFQQNGVHIAQDAHCRRTTPVPPVSTRRSSTTSHTLPAYNMALCRLWRSRLTPSSAISPRHRCHPTLQGLLMARARAFTFPPLFGAGEGRRLRAVAGVQSCWRPALPPNSEGIRPFQAEAGKDVTSKCMRGDFNSPGPSPSNPGRARRDGRAGGGEISP